jgi:cyclopropane-fatty-acyl-phospholipid synthase
LLLLAPGGDGPGGDAETAALALTCERAGVADGQDILELGCGWGSLTLWLAEHYPTARITAVSNSHAQRQHIEALAAQRGLTNLQVITADMNDFDTQDRFDRVISVEMFEHMRNWGALFQRIQGWLRPGGRFFMHIFCHRDRPYPFEDQGDDDWMSRHFFSGGIMPSDALPLRFQEHLALRDQWRWSGRHYERTANAWLANLDAARRHSAHPGQCYGADQAALWCQRWRLFFLAVAETFGFEGGDTWGVGHYLFERPAGWETRA